MMRKPRTLPGTLLLLLLQLFVSAIGARQLPSLRGLKGHRKGSLSTSTEEYQQPWLQNSTIRGTVLATLVGIPSDSDCIKQCLGKQCSAVVYAQQSCTLLQASSSLTLRSTPGWKAAFVSQESNDHLFGTYLVQSGMALVGELLPTVHPNGMPLTKDLCRRSCDLEYNCAGFTWQQGGLCQLYSHIQRAVTDGARVAAFHVANFPDASLFLEIR